MEDPRGLERIRAHGFEPGQIVLTFDRRGEDLAAVIGASEYRLLVEYPTGQRSGWIASKLCPATPDQVNEYRRQVHREKLARRLLGNIEG
jgi:hypothetical protein